MKKSGQKSIRPEEVFDFVKARMAETEKRPFVVAIDGPAGSGKTTLGGILGEAFGTEVIHMDDFYLPPELRTEERFAEPGGNVHYERFLEEVCPHLSKKADFSYQIYSFIERDYIGVRSLKNPEIRIVEGSYSHHPKLGAYADLKICLSIDFETQMARILKRNGPEKAEMFRNRWIPFENRYFEAYSIAENADVIVEAK